jgi:acyl carrier protein
MVPSAFVVLEGLPLTSNGKVDRKALPSPDFSARQHQYVAPRTEIEKVLCEIWQEVLGLEQVGIEDNFFQLGGHSLLIVKLLSQLKQKMNITVQLKDMFDFAVLLEMSVHIEGVLLQNKTEQLREQSENEMEIEW